MEFHLENFAVKFNIESIKMRVAIGGCDKVFVLTEFILISAHLWIGYSILRVPSRFF